MGRKGGQSWCLITAQILNTDPDSFPKPASGYICLKVHRGEHEGYMEGRKGFWAPRGSIEAHHPTPLQISPWSKLSASLQTGPHLQKRDCHRSMQATRREEDLLLNRASFHEEKPQVCLWQRFHDSKSLRWDRSQDRERNREVSQDRVSASVFVSIPLTWERRASNNIPLLLVMETAEPGSSADG